MFNKQHYQFIADCIKDTRERWGGVSDNNMLNMFIGILTQRLAQDNLLFNEDKFLKACCPVGIKQAKHERG